MYSRRPTAERSSSESLSSYTHPKRRLDLHSRTALTNFTTSSNNDMVLPFVFQQWHGLALLYFNNGTVLPFVFQQWHGVSLLCFNNGMVFPFCVSTMSWCFPFVFQQWPYTLTKSLKLTICFFFFNYLPISPWISSAAI